MPAATTDLYLLGVFLLLALLPGLAVVAAPWPVVPFLSLAFWLGTWAWGDWLGWSRESLLHTSLLLFVALSALRLPRPMPASRPRAGTLAVLIAACAALLPLAIQRISIEKEAPEHALQARLLVAHDGSPLTRTPLEPGRPFGVPAGLVLLAADVAALAPVPVWRATLLVGLAARGLLALALLFLGRRLKYPNAALAALLTLGLWAGLPLGTMPALELAAAFALMAVALMSRGTTRAPAVAAGACAAAAWIAAAGVALLVLVPGLAWAVWSWTRTTMAPRSTLNARLLAAGFGLLIFAGPGLLRVARVDLGGPARAGLGFAFLLALAVVVMERGVGATPWPRRAAAVAVLVAVGGLGLSMARDSVAPSLNADDFAAMAFLRQHGTPLDAVCVDDPLRAAWLPAVAERPVGITSCRWRYVLQPVASASDASAAFSAGTLQIIELK